MKSRLQFPHLVTPVSIIVPERFYGPRHEAQGCRFRSMTVEPWRCKVPADHSSRRDAPVHSWDLLNQAGQGSGVGGTKRGAPMSM